MRQTLGRIELDVQPRGDGIYLRLLATDPNDPLRNIRVLMPGFADDEQTIFHPRFLASLAPFEVLRFMGWQRTNDSMQQRWTQRPTPELHSQATARGVALEYMLALCNRTGKQPWFCMPHLADDEYVERFAVMVREGLDPNLSVYVEHSNEVWNAMFAQAKHAEQRGLTLGLSKHPTTARLRYHARRSVEIFEIWARVFGGTERVVRVLSGQHGNAWANREILSWRDAGRKADLFAIAPYFGGGFGHADQLERMLALTPAELVAVCGRDAREQIARVAQTRALAAEYGLALAAYECGQHLVGVGAPKRNDKINALFDAANRHPHMRAVYREYLEGWSRAGGGTALLFSHISRYTKHGRWGLLERQDQEPADAPKLQGVLDYAAAGTRSGR